MSSLQQVLHRRFYLISIVLTGSLLLIAAQYTGLVTAIKGSYTLLGLLLAFVLTSMTGGAERVSRERASVYRTVVIALWFLGVAVAAFSGVRVYGLVVCLPLGYVLLLRQTQSPASPTSIVAQASLLVTFEPFTKYLLSGFYFGNGDIFDHLRYVDALLQTGLAESLARYTAFPGFHTLIGATRILSGLPTYDSAMLLLITLFAALVAATYLLIRELTDDETAVAVAVAMTLIYYVPYYATIVFPQSVAVVLFVFFLYLTLRTPGEGQRISVSALTLLFAFALVGTHHLTLVIFAPAVVVIYLLQAVTTRVSPSVFERIEVPRPTAFAFIGSLAVTYWTYQRDFLGELIYFVFVVFIDGFFVTESSSVAAVRSLGFRLPEVTPISAAQSLASPEGIYFLILVALFALGVHRVVGSPRRYWGLMSFVIVGVGVAPLMFRTPLAATFTRIRLPYSLFFAAVLGIGLVVLLKKLGEGRGQTLVVLLLVATVATTGATVAGEDLYDVNAGEDLYELTPIPEPQRELTMTEYESLQHTSSFVRRGESVSSDDITLRALGRFGDTPPTSGMIATDDGIQTDASLFAYRNRWPNHRLAYTNDNRIYTLALSDRWLAGAVATENKVHTTGEVGVIYLRDGGYVGDRIQTVSDTA